MSSRTQRVASAFWSALSFPLPLEVEFRVRADEWKEDTMLCSSPEIAANHPAYKRIIGMGPEAIPLILEDLSQAPALWFEALVALTDDQPVPIEHAGDMDAMTADWLAWGRTNGHI